MARTLYFCKVSLDSQEVFEYREQDNNITARVTNDILAMINAETVFCDKYSYKDENGKTHEGEIKYSLNIREKDDTSIYGVLYRNSTIFAKQMDDNGELKSYPVDNTEDVEFYYDVLREYIAFVTRRKFGKRMFIDAFEKILNNCSKTNCFTYSFYLALYNEGMTIEEIKESISKDKNIKELIITYRPANPDSGIIKKVQEANKRELILETNATERSIIYKAKGKICIDGSAKVIQEDIESLARMNDGIDIKELTKRGYASVRSVNENGDVKSTTDSKPYTSRIQEGEDFADKAKKGISQILMRVSGLFA